MSTGYDHALQFTLRGLVGKSVTVTLIGGATVSGTLVDVGQDFLPIEEAPGSPVALVSLQNVIVVRQDPA